MEFYYVGGEIEIRPPVPAEKVAGARYVAEGMDDTDSEVIVVDDGDHSTIVPLSGGLPAPARSWTTCRASSTCSAPATATAAGCASTIRPASHPAGSASCRTATAGRPFRRR